MTITLVICDKKVSIKYTTEQDLLKIREYLHAAIRAVEEQLEEEKDK